ncbi:MAG: M13 family metallopeptidase N-terminal domain-containing protein, partial [Ignavibacteria bacterium]
MNSTLNHFCKLSSIVILSFLFSVDIFSQTKSPTYIGINPENIDSSIDPNVNFYEYSNGNWLKNNPVPPEYSRWGSWNGIINKNQEVLRKILEDASMNSSASKGSNLQKLGDLYFLAMDTVTIERDGLNPLKDYLARIDGISSKEDFQKVFAYLKGLRTGGLFSFFGGQDDKNSKNVIFQLFQSGLGMPDRDYYLKDDDRSKKLRSQYGDFAARMFELMGNENSSALKLAQRVIELETRLAKASMSRVDMREAEATYHLMTLEELRSLTPDLSWDLIFNE